MMPGEINGNTRGSARNLDRAGDIKNPKSEKKLELGNPGRNNEHTIQFAQKGKKSNSPVKLSTLDSRSSDTKLQGESQDTSIRFKFSKGTQKDPENPWGWDSKKKISNKFFKNVDWMLKNASGKTFLEYCEDTVGLEQCRGLAKHMYSVLNKDSKEIYVKKLIESNRANLLQIFIVDKYINGSQMIGSGKESKNLVTCIIEKIAEFGGNWVTLGAIILKQAGESIQKHSKRNDILPFAEWFGCEQIGGTINTEQENLFENISTRYRSNPNDVKDKNFLKNFFQERQYIGGSNNRYDDRLREDKQILQKFKNCLDDLKKKKPEERILFLQQNKNLILDESFSSEEIGTQHKLLRIGHSMVQLLLKASFLDEDSLKFLGDMIPEYIWNIPDKNHKNIVQQAILKDNKTFLAYVLQKTKDNEPIMSITNEEFAAKHLKLKCLSQLLKPVHDRLTSPTIQNQELIKQDLDTLKKVEKNLNSMRLCVLAFIKFTSSSRLKLLIEVRKLISSSTNKLLGSEHAIDDQPTNTSFMQGNSSGQSTNIKSTELSKSKEFSQSTALSEDDRLDNTSSTTDNINDSITTDTTSIALGSSAQLIETVPVAFVSTAQAAGTVPAAFVSTAQAAGTAPIVAPTASSVQQPTADVPAVSGSDVQQITEHTTAVSSLIHQTQKKSSATNNLSSQGIFEHMNPGSKGAGIGHPNLSRILTAENLQNLSKAKETFKSEAAKSILDQVIAGNNTEDELELIRKLILKLSEEDKAIEFTLPDSEGFRLLALLCKEGLTRILFYCGRTDQIYGENGSQDREAVPAISRLMSNYNLLHWSIRENNPGLGFVAFSRVFERVDPDFYEKNVFIEGKDSTEKEFILVALVKLGWYDIALNRLNQFISHDNNSFWALKDSQGCTLEESLRKLLTGGQNLQQDSAVNKMLERKKFPCRSVKDLPKISEAIEKFKSYVQKSPPEEIYLQSFIQSLDNDIIPNHPVHRSNMLAHVIGKERLDYVKAICDRYPEIIMEYFNGKYNRIEQVMYSDSTKILDYLYDKIRVLFPLLPVCPLEYALKNKSINYISFILHKEQKCSSKKEFEDQVNILLKVANQSGKQDFRANKDDIILLLNKALQDQDY